MGSGTYSAAAFNSSVLDAATRGEDTFRYSSATMAAPVESRKAHQTLDPEGVEVREARDNDEHPVSVPVIVWFDVTGSMSRVPRQLQLELPKLLEIITFGGYVTDPQICFGAIGDAVSDRIPLQVAQFESDNRMDEHLGNIVLEGGGGGGNHESYELAFYFLARHTATDAWDKRGHKGYAFIIGDERSYEAVSAAQVSRVFGDDIPQDIPLDEIIAEAQERWEIFFIQPGQTMYWGNSAVEEWWSSRLGQNYVKVEDPAEVGETIAKLAGGMESSLPASATPAAATP